MHRTKALWNFQKTANGLRTWSLYMRIHGTVPDHCSDADALQKRIRSQKFGFCSRLIPQFRCDCTFFTRISRAILSSTRSPAKSSCTTSHPGNLWSRISLKACFSRCFEVSWRFSEEGKARIAHEVACNGRDLKLEHMSWIFPHARHPFESVYHWPRLKQNVRAAHSGW